MEKNHIIVTAIFMTLSGYLSYYFTSKIYFKKGLMSNNEKCKQDHVENENNSFEKQSIRPKYNISKNLNTSIGGKSIDNSWKDNVTLGKKSR